MTKSQPAHTHKTNREEERPEIDLNRLIITFVIQYVEPKSTKLTAIT